ncbi:DUF4625 domain-containing protein [Flavobacterium procerum]|uniref:DUF4625 domain-containing protein n=1 Tax=Flavobacterium procerum TaxID=1455569 RepID=A0ABV6BM10_9FLAO
MNTRNRMKPAKIITAFFLSALFFTACNNDDNQSQTELPKAALTNIEIGLNNNEMGIAGRDFHFNADVLAGYKIDKIEVKILPRNGEKYSKEWKHEIIWEQYKGAKNTNVHKHFTIPEDAVEGTYDFVIIVNDQNGSILEQKHSISIYKPDNLPVDPKLDEFSVSARTDKSRVLYILSRGGYRDPATLQYGDYEVKIDNNETLSAAATISGLKGDGKIYIVLINKKHSHRPESINAIDFSKAIVVDAFEHKNMEQTDKWSNVNFERPNFPNISRLPIGSSTDNNSPISNSIDGHKIWESGKYYIGVIYKNTTYNIGLYHYIEVDVKL